MSSEDIRSATEHEQAYVSMLYTRLDRLREQTADRLRHTLRSPGATPQALLERDAFAAECAEHAARLDAAENGLCFGRLDMRDGGRLYIGRIGIRDEDAGYEPLLVDWRAPAARPFYLATALSPGGVGRRRHIDTVGRRVTGVHDETLDLTTDGGPHGGGLTGEAALLAALGAGRTGRMNDIVETIQAEQDRVIRSDHRGVLVVQGGPGTGKTAVALHRAAYLLYTHRERLTRRGVLVIGPSSTFLRYIGQVLPALGETGVLLSTVAELFPGVSATRAEPAPAAELKGSGRMAEVLARAVRDRQFAVPEDGFEVAYEGEDLLLTADACRRLRERAQDARLPHNAARPMVAEWIVDALAWRYVGRIGADVLVGGVPGEPADGDLGDLFDDRPHEDGLLGGGLFDDDDELLGGDFLDGVREADFLDGALAGGAPAGGRREAGPLLMEEEVEDIRRDMRDDPAVLAAVEALWPRLTPQRLLADLFASPGALERAAPGLTAAERESLLRAPGGWSPADVPLLDEAAELLGEDDSAARRRERREREERIGHAREALDVAYGSRSVDADVDEEAEYLSAFDLLDAEELAERYEERDARTAAERAAADRTWAFGHVIVDEAQELSAMAWRTVMRRCPTRWMTLVGDVAQTGDPAGAASWERALAPHVGDRWRLERLGVNYRTPAEVAEVAADVLAAFDPGLEPPRAVRSSGVAPWCLRVPRDEVAARLGGVAAREAAEVADGRLAVLVPASRLAEWGAAVADAVPGAHWGPDPGPDAPVVVLDVARSKGLEFDAVLVAEPGLILSESPRGLNDLYVALTRSTRRLGVVYSGELPSVLGRLADGEPVDGCAPEYLASE